MKMSAFFFMLRNILGYFFLEIDIRLLLKDLYKKRTKCITIRTVVNDTRGHSHHNRGN